MSAEKELQEMLKPYGGLDGLPEKPEKITELSKSLSLEAHTLLLSKLKSSREFYKRMLLEERRKKNPNSFRYEDAEIHIRKYNIQGKTLNDLLEAKKV